VDRKCDCSAAVDGQAQRGACVPRNDEGSVTSEGARQLKAAGADRGAVAGASSREREQDEFPAKTAGESGVVNPLDDFRRLEPVRSARRLQSVR
jgi:hypothetical protein